MRELTDLTIFNEDGGATKPTKIDADQTTHQMVTDLARRQIWLKIPNPSTDRLDTDRSDGALELKQEQAH